MSTGFDAATGPGRGDAPGRHGWWVVPEVVLFAMLAVLAVPYLGATGSESGVFAATAERGSRLLELASPAEHHDHGHEVTAEDRVLCGIDVFGVEPPAAVVLDEVETLYGYYFCAVGRPGIGYMISSRSDGPIVIQFTGTPTITIALSGRGYQDRVRAMMPDQYEQYCFNGLPDATVADAVKSRYEAQVQA